MKVTIKDLKERFPFYTLSRKKMIYIQSGWIRRLKEHSSNLSQLATGCSADWTHAQLYRRINTSRFCVRLAWGKRTAHTHLKITATFFIYIWEYLFFNKIELTRYHIWHFKKIHRWIRNQNDSYMRKEARWFIDE